MKILVIGASKGTGAEAVKAAVARGQHVTAFARSPQNLAFQHPLLSLRQGDFHQAASVDAAVAGHDAVIITASAASLKDFSLNPRYFSQGTAYVIEAMKKHGVRRLVVLSALGTGESRALAGFFVAKVLVGWLLKTPYEDHERQEQQVMTSSLDWVIARPGRLTNGPGRKRYVTETEVKPVPKAISRADVADFLIRAASEDTWLGKAVMIGG
ncbi:MAG: NAD(P)H-binding protein [Pseudomonadota bacterium]